MAGAGPPPHGAGREGESSEKEDRPPPPPVDAARTAEYAAGLREWDGSLPYRGPVPPGEATDPREWAEFVRLSVLEAMRRDPDALETIAAAQGTDADTVRANLDARRFAHGEGKPQG